MTKMETENVYVSIPYKGSEHLIYLRVDPETDEVQADFLRDGKKGGLFTIALETEQLFTPQYIAWASPENSHKWSEGK